MYAIAFNTRTQTKLNWATDTQGLRSHKQTNPRVDMEAGVKLVKLHSVFKCTWLPIQNIVVLRL